MNDDRVRIYDRSELLNQSSYLMSPHNSQAYLSGRAAFFMPDDDPLSPNTVGLGGVLGAAVFTVALGLILLLFSTSKPPALPLGPALGIAGLVVIIDVLILRSYIRDRKESSQKRNRYTWLSKNGKLLTGQIVNSRFESHAAGKGVGTTFFISYNFQTPEGKLIEKERRITSKQYKNQPPPGTSVAVLYANDNDFELL